MSTSWLTKPSFADELDLETALAPRVIGDPDAPLLIAEYFSMTCGYCANFHISTYPLVKKNWIDTGKAQFEYRDFPLSELAIYAHALARAVPEAAYEGMLDICWPTIRMGGFPVSVIGITGYGADCRHQ